MSLQSLTNINVDFYDKKYILINAKQLDKSSRFLSVTCYNHGEPFRINAVQHSAYIRYRKSDGYSVLNSCEINNQGKIMVELTEQMLACDGICYADLIVVEGGSADVDPDTGKIIDIDGSSILSTMTFCIDVSEIAVANSEIESKYEINVLNKTLEKYEAEYMNVVKTAKSWAVGGTDTRPNEDTDNSMYYSGQAYLTAINASKSEENALEYMKDAEGYMDEAQKAALEIKSRLDEMVDAFSPRGTISFEDLQALTDADAGHLYVISDNFTPSEDDNFKKDIVGTTYPAGTIVYYTDNGYWDCLVGMSVAGVKGNNEDTYRTGNINLTPADIGAIPSTDIATLDDIKEYFESLGLDI